MPNAIRLFLMIRICPLVLSTHVIGSKTFSERAVLGSNGAGGTHHVQIAQDLSNSNIDNRHIPMVRFGPQSF
jgi:hypothetical protein